MQKKINDILENYTAKMKKVNDLKELESLKVEIFGKNSDLTNILKSMKDLPNDKKIEIGNLANNSKEILKKLLNDKLNFLNNEIVKELLNKEKIDLSINSINKNFGTKHPLNLVIEEISDIFTSLGYQMVNGYEIETDVFNFQNLNLPKNHPARDMQDTFYVNEDLVLRTHCTNMTARMLTDLAKRKSSNLAAISYGNVYRRDDDDATHSHQFMQIDGFAVGEKISFANLKWILKYMCQRLFGESIEIRMRPSFFPFTEPSIEVDVSCFKCSGKGCAICKHSGWIEILGAGMINEQVLKLNNLDSKKITALAFGIGVERIAMLKFGISNIRNFYENNIKFLEQFKFFGE